MSIVKKPFKKYNLEPKEKGFVVVSLKLNLEEQAQLVIDKKKLNQTKDGTAIKQLMRLGSKVILDPKLAEYMDIVSENKRKNKRLGIVDFD